MKALIIEEFMNLGVGRARWTPDDRNPVDVLTKHKGAHMEPLLDVMRTGHYSLRPEKEELEARRVEKDEKGYIQRRKVTYKGSIGARGPLRSWPRVKAQGRCVPGTADV